MAWLFKKCHRFSSRGDRGSVEWNWTAMAACHRPLFHLRHRAQAGQPRGDHSQPPAGTADRTHGSADRRRGRHLGRSGQVYGGPTVAECTAHGLPFCRAVWQKIRGKSVSFSGITLSERGKSDGIATGWIDWGSASQNLSKHYVIKCSYACCLCLIKINCPFCRPSFFYQ